jgi:hypothetical protein
MNSEAIVEHRAGIRDPVAVLIAQEPEVRDIGEPDVVAAGKDAGGQTVRE